MLTSNVSEDTRVLRFVRGTNHKTKEPQWQAESGNGTLCVPHNRGELPKKSGEYWNCRLLFLIAPRIAVVELVSPYESQTRRRKKHRMGLVRKSAATRPMSAL